MLIDDENLINKYRSRWCTKIGAENMIELEEYRACFSYVYYITNIVKLRNFQYRLLLDKIFTNKELYEWGVVESPHCTFCQLHQEDVTHLLWDCHYAQSIWTKFFKWAYEKGNIITCSKVDILFNNAEISQGFLMIVLLIKYYIYSQRCKKEKPRWSEVEHVIRYHYNMEKYNAKCNNNYEKHVRKWASIYLDNPNNLEEY